MPSNGACGPDGWRCHEIKQMPFEFCCDMAELFGTLEHLPDGWSNGLDKVWNVPIPKIDEDGNPVHSLHPLKIRPISLTPVMHRIWGRARMQSLSPWLEEHLAQAQAAYRPKRGPLSEAVHLAHVLETRADDSVWFGVKIDFSKAFNHVSFPWLRAVSLACGMTTYQWDMFARIALHKR
eukprot:567526-Amphidinium_carterae.1